MTVSNNVASFGRGAVAGAAVAAAGVAGAVVAGGSGGVAVAVSAIAVSAVSAVALCALASSDEPPAAAFGALTSVAAIAFTAWHFGGQPAALPAAPVASAPVTTLIAEGKCKDIQTRFTGKDGTRVELILPPGCTLNPAP